MGLNSTHKTNITAIDTALTSAINSLSPADSAQYGTLQVLNLMRLLLERIRVERTQ